MNCLSRTITRAYTCAKEACGRTQLFQLNLCHTARDQGREVHRSMLSDWLLSS